jgi:hypothetical protein
VNSETIFTIFESIVYRPVLKPGNFSKGEGDELREQWKLLEAD